MDNKSMDLEPIEIFKQLENDRHIMQELIIECNTRGIKKSATGAEYRKAYSIALFNLKNGETKYPSTLLTELAKGKVSKEFEAKENAEMEYELVKDKLRNVRLDIQILITFMSYTKEQMKLV